MPKPRTFAWPPQQSLLSALCQCSRFTDCMSLFSGALQRLLDLPTLTSWELLAAQL